MKRYVTISLFTLFMAFFTSLSGVKAQNIDEYQLKAVFVERFSRFIEWPEEEEHKEFVICVVGDEKMYETLVFTYSDRRIKDKKVSIEFISEDSTKKIQNCHVLFIGDCYTPNLKQHIEQYSQMNPLILGNSSYCLELGALLTFRKVNDRIFFDYNKELLADANLNISYKLLQLARNKE